jgi:hypothetical protein
MKGGRGTVKHVSSVFTVHTTRQSRSRNHERIRFVEVPGHNLESSQT